MPRDHRPRRPMPHPLPTSAPLTRPPARRVVPGQVVPLRPVTVVPARRQRWCLRPPHRRPGWGRVVGWNLAGLAGAAAIGGLVSLAVLAVLELVEIVTAMVTLAVAWLQANWPWLVLGAIALLLLLARLRGSSPCSGLHCGGCRGGHR